MFKHINSIEKFHSLLDYYISCLEKEEILSLTFNYRLEGKKFHSKILKKEQFFLPKKEQFEIKKTPEIENIFKSYKRLQQNNPLFYGYPLYMDSTGNLSPLFFVEIFFEEKEDSIVFTKESVTPEFNHYVLTKNNFNLEEIDKIRSEISEEDNFNLKLEKITKLLNLNNKHISPELETDKPLIVTTNPQLVNKAILYSGGKMGFTKGLIEELQKLKKYSFHQLKSTALDIMFDKENKLIPQKNKKDILEVFDLNDSQEKAVVNSFSKDLSVITGPPGTGKSQVVLNVIANAVWSDKTVLFASKNNKAVDVVNDKLKSILSKNLIVRMGSSKHRRNAKLQIHELFQNKNSLKISPNFQNYKLKFNETLKRIGKLRIDINNLAELNDDIESIHKKIDKLTKNISPKLNRYFQKDKYNFLKKLDIENDIKDCKELDLELANISSILKVFLSDIASLNDKYGKPKKIFKHLKKTKNAKETDIVKDIKFIESAKVTKDEICNDLENLKKEKNDIIKNNKIPNKLLRLLKNHNFESFDDLKIKRHLAFLSKKENLLEIIIKKLFPSFSLNRKYKIFNDILETLNKELKKYFNENTAFNSESIENSLNLILTLKKIAYVKKDGEKCQIELKGIEDNVKKVFNSYFNYKGIYQFENIIENLRYLIYLDKKQSIEKEIKKYNGEKDKNRTKRKQIFNKYYLKLSEKTKDYFSPITKKQKFITDDFLSQMIIQKEINVHYNEIENKNKLLLGKPSIYELQTKIEKFQKDKINISKNLFENYWFKKLKNISPKDENHVLRYIDASEKLEKYIEDYSLWRQLVDEQENELQDMLSFLPIWVVTNLSAKNSLPLKENLFDILIIDEASQCDIASALPLFYRAKQVVIIGDPKQLKHISLLRETEDKKIASENNLSELYLDYAFSKNSLYDLSERIIKNKDKVPVLLNQHYRSHKDIIGFSNEYFYEKKLNIMTDETKLIPRKIYPPGIKWVDVKGKTSQTKSPYNKEEANEIIKILKTFKESNLKKISFGIVTIFRSQMELINDMINKSKELKNMDITVGTAHRFQGDEKDIILFSPVISQGIKQTTLSWINKTTQLLNVAITRARSVLIIVGNEKKCCEAGGLLKSLSDHIKPKKQLKFNFDSPIEERLFKRLTKEKIKVVPQYETKVKGTKPYRLDFALFINDNKYNIEVDGDKSHYQKIESDILRDIHLRMDGWKIRRFQANEIQNNIKKVIEEIKRLC